MTIRTYSLPVTPLSGTISKSDSVWLGGNRFFAVFDTTAPVTQGAAVIDGASDLYAATSSLATTTRITTSSGTAFKQAPKLFMLTSSLILCVYNTTITPTTISYNNKINARVYQIGSDNSISIVYDASAVVPMSFLNYAPSGFVAPTARDAFVASCSVFIKVADNQIVFWTRDVQNADFSSSGVNRTTNSLIQVVYDPIAVTLTIYARWTSAVASNVLVTYTNVLGGSVSSTSGWWTFLQMSLVPNTTLVMVADNNPCNKTTYYQGFGFTTNTVQAVYMFDYSTPSSTTPSSTISGTHVNSAIVPLDSTRILEVFSGTETTANPHYSVRVCTSGVWSTDQGVDTTPASNAGFQGVMTYNSVQFMLLLDPNYVLINFAGWNGSNWFSAYGVFRLIGATFQNTSHGVIDATSQAHIFYRGGDCLIPRGRYDSSSTSTYDFYRQQAALGHTFLRYDNPA